MVKYTYEDVVKVFKNNQYTLLSLEYNPDEYLEYLCICGNIYKKKFREFKLYKNCTFCIQNEKANKIFMKHNFELLDTYVDYQTKMKCKCLKCDIEIEKSCSTIKAYSCSNCKKLEMYDRVNKEFNERGCELLEKFYINNHTVMSYRCVCGNISQISYNSFQRGRKCMKCSGTPKHTYEYIDNYFKSNGCILISETYEGNLEKLEYICNCGNTSEITFGNFSNGHRCVKCRSYYIKHTIEFVRESFKTVNYTLLETEYINCETKMRYKCEKGHDSEMSFHCFQTGYRCPKCIYKTEQIVSEFLEKSYTNIISQTKFDWCKKVYNLPFDFLLYDYRIILEVDGIQHFKQVSNWQSPEEALKRDTFKAKLALEHNYSIIRIFQEDIYKNKIDWKKLLIDSIKHYTVPTTIYISKDPELYDKHKETLENCVRFAYIVR